MEPPATAGSCCQSNISNPEWIPEMCTSEASEVLLHPFDHRSRDDLQEWAIKHNISHLALKDLLTIIKNQYNDIHLPSDPRTLLGTPTSTAIVDIPGGQYWHQGLEVCLRNSFTNLRENITIQLNFNIDGLPIYKSSKYQLWPILCNIHQMPHIKPMAIGIFFGKSKPLSVNDYLKPFVDELIPLLSNGLIVNDKIITLRIRCFICDSPARAFVKGMFVM